MLPVPRVSVYGTGEAVVTAGHETRCEGSTLGEALARAWLAVQEGERMRRDLERATKATLSSRARTSSRPSCWR